MTPALSAALAGASALLRPWRELNLSSPRFVALAAAAVVWYAVLLTDGPLAVWIAVPGAVLVVAWATHAREFRYRFGVPVILGCVLVPTVWALIGLVHGNRLQYVLDQAQHFLLFGLYFPMRWAIAQAPHPRAKLWLVPTLVLCALSIGLWLGHVALHFDYGIPTPVLQTALARTDPSRAYRVFLKGDLFLIPAAAFFWVLVTDSKRLDLRNGIGLVASIFASVVTGTRGLWLAVAVTIAWAGYVRRPGFAWVRSFALVAVIGALVLVTPAAAYIQHRINGVIGSVQDESTQIHNTEATALLSAFWHNPLFGSGLGATLPGGLIRASEKPYLYELTFHQMLFQLGIVGTAVFLIPIVWGVLRAATITFRPEANAELNSTHLAAVGGASLVGILLVSATNPYLFSAVGAVVVALALAMVEGAMDATERQQHEPGTAEPSNPPIEASRRQGVGLTSTKGSVVSIVVNFNMGLMVERCLRSLQLRGEPGFVHHIVVWENGSEQALLGHSIGDRWQLGQSTVWYLGGEGNLGYARAVNAAYGSWRERNSIEPVAIHCANPDTVSEPDALANLIIALHKLGWGAAAPLVTFEDGSSRPAAYPPLTPILVVAHFLRLRWMRRFGMRFEQTMSPREVEGAVDGAYIVFAQEAWNAVGGMDGLFGISADDHDICARLKSAGWKIGVVPSSRISHHGATGRRETPLLSQLDGVQGYVRYVSKHYPKRLPAVRHGIWLLLRFRREPLSKELAWWARRAPVQIEPVTSDMEENYRRVLMSFNDRPAAVLASRLQSEWWRRQAGRKRLETSNQKP